MNDEGYECLDSSFASIRPPVEFLYVLDQYLFNEDLCCTLKFYNFVVQEGDRVALFKLGWAAVKEYFVFEWVNSSPKDLCPIVFSSHVLPKNSHQLYQLCYINGENEIKGASTPFQFFPENIPSNSVAQPKFHTMNDEIASLREENQMLKGTIKVLLQQKTIKSYDDKISEVKNLVEGLKLMLEQHQTEIDMFKNKIREGGEEYRKLYLEKVNVERKYKKLKNKRGETNSLDEEKKSNVHSDLDFVLESIPPFPTLH